MYLKKPNIFNKRYALPSSFSKFANRSALCLLFILCFPVLLAIFCVVGVEHLVAAKRRWYGPRAGRTEWFAWYPVKAQAEDYDTYKEQGTVVVWLELVTRNLEYVRDGGFDRVVYYRLIEPSTSIGGEL